MCRYAFALALLFSATVGAEEAQPADRNLAAISEQALGNMPTVVGDPLVNAYGFSRRFFQALRDGIALPAPGADSAPKPPVTPAFAPDTTDSPRPAEAELSPPKPLDPDRPRREARRNDEGPPDRERRGEATPPPQALDPLPFQADISTLAPKPEEAGVEPLFPIAHLTGELPVSAPTSARASEPFSGPLPGTAASAPAETTVPASGTAPVKEALLVPAAPAEKPLAPGELDAIAPSATVSGALAAPVTSQAFVTAAAAFPAADAAPTGAASPTAVFAGFGLGTGVGAEATEPPLSLVLDIPVVSADGTGGTEVDDARPARAFASTAAKGAFTTKKAAGGVTATATALLAKLGAQVRSLSPRRIVAALRGTKEKPAGPARAPASLKKRPIEQDFELPPPEVELASLVDTSLFDLDTDVWLGLAALAALGFGAAVPPLLLGRLLRRRRKEESAVLAALVLFTLVSGEAVAGGSSMGNGGAYLGGDGAEARLASAREQVQRTLRRIGDGDSTTLLCAARRCQPGETRSLCEPLQALTPEQSDRCREFLVTRAAELVAVTAPFRTSGEPLAVATPNGAVRSVAALTTPGADSPVVFHGPAVMGYDRDALIALIVHELGHKIAVKEAGGFLDDVRAFGGFPSGRAFLDVIGAAVGRYSRQHPIPTQAASPPPAAALVAACDFAGTREGAFVAGLALDLGRGAELADVGPRWLQLLAETARRRPDSARALFVAGIIAEPASRDAQVADWFGEYLLREPTGEERALFAARFAQGVPEPSLFASLLGSSRFAEARAVSSPEKLADSILRDLTGVAPGEQELRGAVAAIRKVTAAGWARDLLRKDERARLRLAAKLFKKHLNRFPRPDEAHAAQRQLAAGQMPWSELRATLLSGEEYVALQYDRWGDCRVARRVSAK